MVYSRFFFVRLHFRTVLAPRFQMAIRFLDPLASLLLRARFVSLLKVCCLAFLPSPLFLGYNCDWLMWRRQFCCCCCCCSVIFFVLSLGRCVFRVTLRFVPRGRSLCTGRVRRVIVHWCGWVLSISTVGRTGSVVVQRRADRRRRTGWGRPRRWSLGRAGHRPGTGTRPCSPGRSPVAEIG